MTPCIAFAMVASFALPLVAQVVNVTATGTLTLSWQGSGPQQTATQQFSNTTSLQVSTVGTAAISVGTTTTMTLDALDPPWPGPIMGWWSSAAGEALVTYSASAPVAGVLRLHMVPSCAFPVPPVIDVENDGQIELNGWPGPSQIDIPVVLGPRPIPVRVSAQNVNFGGATCVLTASIEFLSQPGNLTTAGLACGPGLAASLLPPVQQTGRLTLHVDDDPVTPSSFVAAIAFGSTPLSMGTACNPGLIADGWLLVTPTAGGFELPIPLSVGLVGSVYMQHVGLQLPFLLQWSNRVLLTLP